MPVNLSLITKPFLRGIDFIKDLRIIDVTVVVVFVLPEPKM